MDQVAIVVRVDRGLMWRIPLVENESFGIGRSSDNKVHLEGEDSVSRQHAALRWRNGVHELGVGRYANNGIFVNGRDTTQEVVRLDVGDEVRCANVVLRYFVGDGAAQRAEQAMAAHVAGES